MPTYSSRLGLLPANNDWEFALKQNNPFASIVSQQYAPNFQAAGTAANALAGMQWEGQQRYNAANPQPVAFVPSTFAPGSSWSPLLPPSSTLGAGGASGASPADNSFQTVRNVKNPAIQAAIDSNLGMVNSLSNDFSKNPFVTRTNVKSAEQESRIGAAGQRFDADVSNNRQSLADFTTQFLTNTPKVNAATDQDVNAIGEYYGGANSVQSNLDRMANAKKAAVAANVSRALATAQRNANIGRLVSGDSSYLDQQYLDTAGGILANEASQDADLRRANYLGVKDAQTRLAGSRQGLIDASASRLLQPIQANTALGNSELGQAAQLGGLLNQNNLYTLDSPEMQLQRRLGLLGNVSQLDLANNQYGLRAPYGADTRGYLPIQDYGGGGGGGGWNGGGGDFARTPQPVRGAAPDRRSAAASRYKALVGVYPDEDMNYSNEAMNWVLSHNDSGAVQNYFDESGQSPFLDPNFSQSLYDSY